MADRARSAFMTLKSKRQRAEDDEYDFHFVNKRFKAKDKLRDTGKLWWADVYRNWSEEDFKAKMRINRTAFNFILDGIYKDLILTPTNLKRNPASPNRQLL